MNMIVQILKWMGRAWPLIALAFLGLMHCLFLEYINIKDSSINSFVSLSTQIIGGLIVLYSIDENLGLFRKSGLFGELKDYLYSFPLIKRKIKLLAGSINAKASLGEATLTVTRNPKSVDEHIEYLQEQIDELKKELAHKHSKLDQKITEVERSTSEKIKQNDSALKDMKSKLEEVAVGGLKLQLFGVLLVIYGAVAGYNA